MSPQQVLTWIATFTLTLISGCANYDSEHHFESNAVAVKASKSTSVHSDRALVYLFRARVLGQSTSIIAFPPMFFAVDGKLVSVMPLGSFVPLSLEPGRHVFSRLIVEDGLFGSIDLKTTDVNVEVVAGKTYYLGTSYGFLAQPFGLVDESRGSQFVGEAELAKFLHQPRTVVAFSAAVVAMEEKRKSSAATNKPEKDRPSQKTSFSAPGLQDALPSSKQVGEFLEVLATVALVSLLVIGSAAGSGSGSSASLPPPDLTPRPAIRQGAAPAVPWRTSSAPRVRIVVASIDQPRGRR